jgi:hypothetical protein
VNGGELEARNLVFYHGGGSKGAFFNITSGGVLVVNQSQISFDPLVGYAYDKIYIYIIYIYFVIFFFFFFRLVFSF